MAIHGVAGGTDEKKKDVEEKDGGRYKKRSKILNSTPFRRLAANLKTNTMRSFGLCDAASI